MDRRCRYFAVPLLHNQSVSEHLDNIGLSFCQRNFGNRLFENVIVFYITYIKLDFRRNSDISVGRSRLDRKALSTSGFFANTHRPCFNFAYSSLLLNYFLHGLCVFSQTSYKKSNLCLNAMFDNHLPRSVKMAKDTSR